MPTVVPPEAIKRARRLRRNMTEGERRLWSELKEFRRWYGVHVRKQAPIGPYIVDFAIHERKLVIEVDGEHHFTAEGLARDARRDAWLEGVGYRVLRLSTGDLSESFDGCVQEILDVLGLMSEQKQPPPLTPPLKGGGFGGVEP
jgi:very-short-patch-repair endonuclease